MTLYQFKLLDKEEQLFAIYERGVFLADRIDGDYTYKLYQLDTFYVEEQWHTKFNVRRSYISFISHELLQPYIDKIDLTALGLHSKP